MQLLLCSIGMQNIQILYWVPFMFVVTCFLVAVIKNGCGLLDDGTLKSAVSQESELIKWADFFACWYKFRKANVNLVIIGWAWSKMGIKFRSYGTEWSFRSYPLQLYLLRMMFCSSAHRKKSFRTWFLQMLFYKSLINCKKIVSYLMQYSKKYWKWPGTYVLILHSYWRPQFQNFAIPPIWLSSYSITQRYCYPCITCSLNNSNFYHSANWNFWG